jgi:hypothetical protein
MYYKYTIQTQQLASVVPSVATVYASILYPCINQLVIVCVELFAQKECYIDDAANILVLSTAIY